MRARVVSWWRAWLDVADWLYYGDGRWILLAAVCGVALAMVAHG